MACRQSESDDDFHSLHSPDSPTQTYEAQPVTAMEVPAHPVASLQGPFEESILESTQQHAHDLGTTDGTLDAQARRQQVLDAEQYDDSWTARWRQRPEARYHPLCKLMAQIVFGLHLLQQEQAKSDEEVVKILQGHVNEVDSFLEQTAEDFDLAIKDIQDRIRYMRLPMEHLDVFFDMLQDKKFRSNLMHGNDKIENIVERSERAMNAAMMDVESGVKSTKELATYLAKVRNQYPVGRPDIADIFNAMRGNEKGWTKYLVNLESKSKMLEDELTALRTVIGEISKLVAVASRYQKSSKKANRAASSTMSQKSGSISPDVRSKFSRDTTRSPTVGDSPGEPLVSSPEHRNGAVVPVMSKPHPIPFETRYEQPRASPPMPTERKTSVRSHRPNDSLSGTRPRCSTEQGSKHRRGGSSANNPNNSMANNSTPLGSNPPNAAASGLVREMPFRSQTVGANEGLAFTPPKVTRHGTTSSVDKPMPTVTRFVHVKKDPYQFSRQASEPWSSKAASRYPQTAQKDHIWTSGAAFARRISKRLRHERISDHENPFIHVQPSSRPIDSAHSSNADKTRDIHAMLGAGVTMKKVAYQFPPARIGFDPTNTDFGAPLNTMSPNVIAQINGLNAKSLGKSAAGAKPGRTMSLRKFFNRGSTRQ